MMPMLFDCGLQLLSLTVDHLIIIVKSPLPVTKSQLDRSATFNRHVLQCSHNYNAPIKVLPHLPHADKQGA